MDQTVKRIGILTSGGDCPGMNTAVRAATLAALDKGIKVFGVQHGYQGLYDNQLERLTLEKVDTIHAEGGTILRTARFLRFLKDEQRQQAIDQCLAHCRMAKLDGLVCIGGDGTFRGARDLAKAGLPCVGVPGTIDNDIACTDYTIGYDTALNTVMHLADSIADMARSMDRCMVIEVMGNKAGDLTLYGSLACGATAVMLMEYGGYDFPETGEMSDVARARFESDITQRILKAKSRGKSYFLVFVAEGITGKKDKDGKTRYPGGVDALAKAIEAATGIESRADILGYMQRGGHPTARDRILATRMGDYAVQLLVNGLKNRVVVVHNQVIKDYEIDQGLRMFKPLNEVDYHLAWRVSL
jgi:6-phosphofructokinase 1